MTDARISAVVAQAIMFADADARVSAIIAQAIMQVSGVEARASTVIAQAIVRTDLIPTTQKAGWGLIVN